MSHILHVHENDQILNNKCWKRSIQNLLAFHHYWHYMNWPIIEHSSYYPTCCLPNLVSIGQLEMEQNNCLHFDVGVWVWYKVDHPEILVLGIPKFEGYYSSWRQTTLICKFCIMFVMAEFWPMNSHLPLAKCWLFAYARIQLAACTAWDMMNAKTQKS